MSIIDTLLAENENFKFVSAKFPPYTGSKSYYYKTMLDVVVDDFAVVYVTNDNSFKVVQITEVHEPLSIELSPHIDYRWLVQKVDCKQYQESLNAERELAATLRKAETRRRVEEVRRDVLAHLNDDEQQSVKKLVRL